MTSEEGTRSSQAINRLPADHSGQPPAGPLGHSVWSENQGLLAPVPTGPTWLGSAFKDPRMGKAAPAALLSADPFPARVRGPQLTLPGSKAQSTLQEPPFQPAPPVCRWTLSCSQVDWGKRSQTFQVSVPGSSQHPRPPL